MDQFDVIVVGAGHAGDRSRVPSSRMGCGQLALHCVRIASGIFPVTVRLVARLKGISRRKLMLGGQMGVTTDYTMTHNRRVGTGKGRCTSHSARVCKSALIEFMQAFSAIRRT
ncbi:MAG: hypothetical protein R2688_04780 [Fimbriimonadaceae bacterium]